MAPKTKRSPAEASAPSESPFKKAKLSEKEKTPPSEMAGDDTPEGLRRSPRLKDRASSASPTLPNLNIPASTGEFIDAAEEGKADPAKVVDSSLNDPVSTAVPEKLSSGPEDASSVNAAAGGDESLDWSDKAVVTAYFQELLERAKSFTDVEELFKYIPPSTTKEELALDNTQGDRRQLDLDHLCPAIFCVTEAINFPEDEDMPVRGVRSSLYNPTILYELFNLDPAGSDDPAEYDSENEETDEGKGWIRRRRELTELRTDDRVARPRRVLYIPWRFDPTSMPDPRLERLAKGKGAHFVLFVAQIPAFNRENLVNSTGYPSLDRYDSAPGYLGKALNQDMTKRVRKLATYLDWGHFGHEYNHVTPWWLQPRTIPSARQSSSYSCGLYVVLNAYVHAMGLQNSSEHTAPCDTEEGEAFIETAYRVINLAVNGLVGWKFIYSFLISTGFALPKEGGVSMSRRFEFTIPLRNNGAVQERWQSVLMDENSTGVL